MVIIRWLYEASNDFDMIFSYLEKVSQNYARRFFIKVVELEERLKILPYIGRVVPEIKEERIREIIFDSYRLIYYIKSDNIIEILSILHQSQDFRI